ncbi:MAG TPA: DPP IV N-terminal domain-containing protein [Acidimicrobiales bacterium]|nr:DPP IV N-terminal domain-containing protein [Acidimicrobiales bacterium]
MRPVTTADVARRPLPGTTAPTAIRFSPDGRAVTYLVAEPGSLHQSLVVVDTATGTRRVVPTPGTSVEEAELGIEERLRRERARELAVGVTRYQWADQVDVVLVPMADGLWLLEGLAAGSDEPARRILAADDVDGPILDARLSADGTRVGYVAGDEVHVLDVASGAATQVTAGAAGTGRTNGLAEYVAQEEMGRPYGFWLSPDGARVVFCEVDEAHIPVYRIVHQGSDAVGPDAQEDHRYPFAGAANAHVRVGVVPADGSGASSPVWLDLGSTGIGDDRYVARVDWAGPDAVLVQVEARSQQRLDLVRFDLDVPAGADGVPGRLLLAEESDVWINLHDVLRVLPDGALLWASERTGFRHLEVREPDGGLRHVLTRGDWVVTDVLGVGGGDVWFQSTAGSPIDRHLHRVPLDGSRPPEQLSAGDGVHGGVAHPETGAWVDVHSHQGAPPRTTLRHVAEPDRDVLLHDAAGDPRVAELELRPPELRTIEAADGTELHAAVYRPEAGDGPFPLVVWVYGGPHAQLVTRSWSVTVALRAQLLRQHGFLVAVVDGRGSTDRGLDFEGALRHRMGTVEVDDQVRLVEALVAEGLADPARVGIYGWSYGGYLSALCLARRPDVFRAACAGAPVTSWDGYDTHYTERYMGTPQENPDGYRQASVMTHVEGLRDRHLLLVHGLIDENVHFRHTARLLNALVRADIDHRLLLYPDERHVPRGEADRESMEHRIAEFFRAALR